MTSRERMDTAMRPRDHRPPDRVPVMCQLALGHYFLHSRASAVDIWHDTVAFADALLVLCARYGFDGILVNLPGREPRWRDRISRIEEQGARRIVHWTSGRRTLVPPDDNPHVVDAHGRPPRVGFSTLDPESLYYVEPYDLEGLACQATFPPWQWDTLKYVRMAAPDVSVHGEVFSPFSQFVELLGLEAAMLALADDAPKVHACLDRLSDGAAALASGHFAAGADAVLISSAYAGRGFISPRHYETFVLPYERKVLALVKSPSPDRRVYTHTCGAIGDRLGLMERTATDGIDTLDPPPLGTVDLAEAKQQLADRVFIKGNIDPVNTILRGTPETCYQDARRRVAIGAPGGGYILSTACSVPPHASPANIEQLARAVQEAA